MKIEYRFQEDDASNKSIEELVDKLNQYNLSKISVFYQHTKLFKKKLEDKHKLSSIIDFPFGGSDLSIRNKMVENSIKWGCGSIELVAPFHLLSNSSFTSIKRDVINNFELCKKNQIDISYILDYRTFNYSTLYRVCKLLLRHEINHIYLSTGYRIDDIYDHIIAIAMILKNVPDINITCSANIFTEKHLEILYNSDITSISVNSLASLEMANKFASNL
jgi:deoxyribose-phosphate aldolase|tara:strand:- start:45 stop:701 length:657 start_codon:yes stop_codon:yes gene_type:complete